VWCETKIAFLNEKGLECARGGVCVRGCPGNNFKVPQPGAPGLHNAMMVCNHHKAGEDHVERKFYCTIEDKRLVKAAVVFKIWARPALYFGKKHYTEVKDDPGFMFMNLWTVTGIPKPVDIQNFNYNFVKVANLDWDFTAQKVGCWMSYCLGRMPKSHNLLRHALHSIPLSTHNTVHPT
jgi:hypothetical protein